MVTKTFTFSVIGKRSSTAHTGLGTMLSSSGSIPQTSTNCQSGCIPNCLRNWKRKYRIILNECAGILCEKELIVCYGTLKSNFEVLHFRQKKKKYRRGRTPCIFEKVNISQLPYFYQKNQTLQEDLQSPRVIKSKIWKVSL